MKLLKHDHVWQLQRNRGTRTSLCTTMTSCVHKCSGLISFIWWWPIQWWLTIFVFSPITSILSDSKIRCQRHKETWLAILYINWWKTSKIGELLLALLSVSCFQHWLIQGKSLCNQTEIIGQYWLLIARFADYSGHPWNCHIISNNLKNATIRRVIQWL